MKLPKRIHKNPSAVLLVILLSLSGSSSALNLAPQSTWSSLVVCTLRNNKRGVSQAKQGSGQRGQLGTGRDQKAAKRSKTERNGKQA